MRKLITLAMVAATAALAVPQIAGASDPAAEFGADTRYNADTRSIPLGIGKSVVIDLPRDAKDVLVGDPQVANAVVRTARRAYLIGVKVGQTNVFFFDADGKQIAGFDVAVTRDIGTLRQTLRAALPQANVRVQVVGDGVVLTGVVTNAIESQQAVDIAARAVGNVTGVVNNLTIKAPDQVMLKVAVVEMQRDIAKQLGVNISGQFAYGKTNLSFNSSPGGAGDGTNQIGGGWTSGGNSVSARLRALESAGVIRTLAEPNLTAISGEAATFLAGGEIPYLTTSCAASTGGTSQICTPVTSFKPFGVQLAFVPVVLSDGRISLKVGTSVSELSTEGAVSINGTSVPSLKTRRVETVVELPSGGSMTLAGLLQEQTRNVITGIPAAGQIPILGALFRSREYNNRQTELVIIVTPFIVRPTAEKNLSRPDDGFADASDPQAVFLGKVNRVYGPPGKKDPRRQYHGSYGFIMD
ncbi:type II secretion system protein D precursor [Variibacter gotjawalensis]|uniref:Type II secretion system protein D n=1 Tax=Variibacter gotjawalensis TaxID=1333996 RepID=A0A0S3PPK5_9BRAD|nr:type II and III secretion system protein family protein [Variibacter gotjawalensis]NIK48108.1 pilus assembly protein CpaC [Variibacter gotjawalensis]RZS49984.1 pilus assembly protein CpaC [Variibacter gotjawalensis]BAT57811.1 type II secretion system protein D precursor [Variibacter gotjawalensis]